MERQTIEWEKIFASHIFHKGLISKIYKELIQLKAQQLVIDSLVKTPSANSGDMGLTSGLGRSPGGGKGTHSSILAWKIPWIEESGGLQSVRSQRVRHDLSFSPLLFASLPFTAICSASSNSHFLFCISFS